MKEPRALEEYRRAIVAACPELADATFAILASGWHSTAVEVGGRWVFKFPRGAEAEAALLREAAVLRLVRPAVSLPVPAPQVFAGPPLFSRHEKLPGGYLLGEDYRRLDEPARQAVGDALGRFYAELHRLPPARMRAVGALPVRPWESPAAMRRRALPLLPAAWRERAERLVREYAKLPADPLGSIFGFFDGHGWNMAFDSEAGRLNGVYDFADAGIGPLHQEFIYSAFIDADLTERIVAAYERFSGRRLERRRIALLTAAHRLSELAELADEPRHLPEMLAGSLVTLQVTALSMLFGILIALLLAFARLGGNRPLRAAAGAWISIARNTPALFQIYILYFGLGSFGLHVSSWFALLAGVTFNNAGYLAETFRGGLQAVPETQLRAARSLGMSAPQAYRLVVIPQLLRVVFYPLTNQLVWAMLMTSLGVVVGLTDDLTGVTQALNVKTFRTFEYFALAAVLYFAMAKLLVLAARLLGWRLFRY